RRNRAAPPRRCAGGRRADDPRAGRPGAVERDDREEPARGLPAVVLADLPADLRGGPARAGGGPRATIAASPSGGSPFVNPFLAFGQIIVSVALIFAILLQARGTGLSGTFGGDSAAYRSRRGI